MSLWINIYLILLAQVAWAHKTNNSDNNGNSSNPLPSSVIVAVCLGSVLLAVIGLIIIFLVLRRRQRKSLPVAVGLYAFSPSSAPSPSASRPRFLRKFWDNSGDDSSTISPASKNSNIHPNWPETINFYHTPRPPPKAKKSSHLPGGGSSVSNGTDASISSIRFSPKTERQMEIEERIEELKGKLALLQRTIRVPEGRPDSRTLTNLTHNMRLVKWRQQIETLQDLMGSDWALGRTDIIPMGLHSPEPIE